ncbi:MAG: hypothetical protein QXE51_02640 [Nitrososphaeria archaeon]
MSKKREKTLPDSVFLDRKNRKYPVKLTSKSPYNVHALRAVVHYATMYHEDAIASKARKLLSEYKRTKKVSK